MIFGEMSKEMINDLKLNLNDNQKAYFLKSEDEYIGFGTILFNSSNNNIIYIFVQEKYRSKGYGALLFKSLIDILKRSNYNDLIFDLTKDQNHIKSIVSRFGAVQISNKNEIEKYILKL